MENVEKLFEHAVELGMKYYSNETEKTVRKALTDSIQFMSGGLKDPDEYMRKDYIIRTVTEVWLIPWVPMEELHHERCDCGSKHTYHPNNHSSWCTVLNPHQWIEPIEEIAEEQLEEIVL